MNIIKSYRLYLYVFITLVVFILLNLIGALRPITFVLGRGMSIIGGGFYRAITITRELPLWQEKNNLEKNIQTLQSEVIELQSLRTQVETLKRENETIRYAIQWGSDKKRKYIVSKIIGRPLDTPKTYLIINQGERDGIQIGFPAIIGKDIIVGIVVSTEEFTSYVRLITDNQSKISAKTLENREPVGVVEGELGLTLSLELIPNNIILNEGDIIITSGLDERIPEGLILGTVTNSITESGEFFKSTSLNTAYNTNDLNILSIISNELE